MRTLWKAKDGSGLLDYTDLVMDKTGQLALRAIEWMEENQ